MKIEDIRQMYQQGNIDTKEYAARMFEKYEELFAYKELLKQSKVKEISINEQEVLFKIFMNSIANNAQEYEVIMELQKKDSAAVQNTILSLGDYESEELDLVSRIVDFIIKEENKATFFDIGANLGWYTINIKKQYPDMEVYAFEPVKENYLRLQKHMSLNQVSGVNAYNIGMHCENTNMEFYYDICASGASSLANLLEHDDTEIVSCKVVRLDDFVNEHSVSSIDFIKCDVEGSELFVYEGGLDSIKRYKPVIFSEMLRKWAAKFGYHPNDIIELLATAGYECYVIGDQGKLKKFSRVDERTVEKNYFFFHPQKHEAVLHQMEEGWME